MAGGLSENISYINELPVDGPNVTGNETLYPWGNYSYYDYEQQPMTSEQLYYHYLWNYVAPSIFGIITIVGTMGNSLVAYVILSRKYMMTVTNILLLNLAFADISFLVICVSFTAYKYAAFSWALGETFCKFVQYCMYVTAYVTVYTLVAVSALRFLTIVCSTSSVNYRTKKNAVILSALIWIVMLLLNIPKFLVHRTKTFGDYTFCGMQNDAIEPVFVTFFVFAYALPLLVISLLYLLIVLHLRQAKSASLVQSSGQTGRTARACKVIFLVVLMFGLSWLPLHINSLVAHYGTLPKGAWYEVFRILWNCLAYSNSCVNPLIYNCFSQDFRKAFREIVFCGGFFFKPSLRHRTSDRMNETETMTIVGGQTLTTL